MTRVSLLFALLATSAMAEAKSISQIYFSGLGIITAAAGHPGGPRVGQWNRIEGLVRFGEPNCLAADIDGTIDLGRHYELCDGDWDATDRFLLSPIRPASLLATAQLTFDHGALVGVYFYGLNGPSYLTFDTTSFYGGWYVWGPRDYGYSGSWSLDKVRIAYDGEPLPGTVPEPASWALLVTGFGVIGAGLRRQRRLAATA